MTNGKVHLVGSIPFASAAEVFERTSGALGDLLTRIPDGETGARLDWINALEPVFSQSPFFERSTEAYLRSTNPNPSAIRYQLKEGVNQEDVRFSELPDVANALQSYKEFARLKQAGKVRPTTRFQVALATAFSVVRRFVVQSQQAAIEPIYDRALAAAVARICDSIPRKELAIQWDVASGVFEPLERGQPTRFGKSTAEMLDTFVAKVVELGNLVPPEVELIYHLCYGDNQHRHTIEPSSTAIMVEFANRLSREVVRPIQLIHMPVPRNRSDSAYYEPLSKLALKPGTEVALGLVHYTDGAEGSIARARTAARYLPTFLVATECGFGRRDPTTILDLLRIHAEVAKRLASGPL